MSNRKIPDHIYDNETKNKILKTATELFALKGYNAVTMRTIANSVGIKMSSIYYYYESKEALMKDILLNFKSNYMHYFDWLTAENKKANSLEQLMDNMFNEEFVKMRDPMGCLNMSILIKEQHNNDSIRKCVFDILFEYSVKHLKEDFDSLIKKGITPPSNTKMIATIFMLCVISINDLRIHDYMGEPPPLDSDEIYKSLKNFLSLALTAG